MSTYERWLQVEAHLARNCRIYNEAAALRRFGEFCENPSALLETLKVGELKDAVSLAAEMLDLSKWYKSEYHRSVSGR